MFHDLYVSQIMLLNHVGRKTISYNIQYSRQEKSKSGQAIHTIWFQQKLKVRETLKSICKKELTGPLSFPNKT